MLARLARASFRRRWLVLVVWIVSLVALNATSASLGSTEEAGFTLPDTESKAVLDLLERAAPRQSGEEGEIVFEVESGVAEPAARAAITEFLAATAAIDGVGSVGDPFTGDRGQVSPDGTVAFARLVLEERQAGPNRLAAASEIVDLRAAAPDGVRVELGGDLFVDFEPPQSETIGLAAAVFILLLAFGSVLAVGLPIGVALFGIGTGVALIGITGHLVDMPDFTLTLALMIGLGVGIDYALFIVTRYRERLALGDDPETATVLAIDTAGRAVLFAGTIVIISMLGMLLMGVPFIRGLGIGSALAVLTTMIASLTLLPAFLGFAGRRIDLTTWSAVIALVIFNVGLLAFALGVQAMLPVGLAVALVIVVAGRFVPSLRRQAPIHQPSDATTNVWHRWSRAVQRHPWRGVIGGLVVLLVLAAPVFSMRLGNSDNGNLPENQTARGAYDLLAEAFGPGFNGPLLLALDLPAGTGETELGAVATAIAADPGVAFVAPAQVVPDAGVAFWQVVPISGPQDEATTDLIDRLRDDVIPTTGLDVLVGGNTAIFADFSDYLAGRLPIFVGTVLLLSFVLLMAVFRSVLVPLKAVVLNLLSIAASYGVVVAVFQWGWGGSLIGIGKGGPIEAFIPMMLFAIVFGLSMDYEVFLLSRMREEYDRTGDNASAVADGLAATARVITSAAAIMVFVFGSFLLEDLRQIKLFGLGLAIAVFIDATVVRMVLVPATMELLGNRNWWLPGWLARLLPKIDVEGHVATPPRPTHAGDGDRDDVLEPVG